MRRAVFLDRDGVLSHLLRDKNGQVLLRSDGLPLTPTKVSEFEIIDGVDKVLRQLDSRGFLNIVTTNRPDISRGLVSAEELSKMDDLMKQTLPLHDIFTCQHDKHHNCDCRKPKPGMLLDAAKKWNLDLNRSFIVGDTNKDIEAGKNAGCKTILIDAAYNQQVNADFRVKSLADILLIIS